VADKAQVKRVVEKLCLLPQSVSPNSSVIASPNSSVIASGARQSKPAISAPPDLWDAIAIALTSVLRPAANMSNTTGKIPRPTNQSASQSAAQTPAQQLWQTALKQTQRKSVRNI
jgi:hypothetical protein